MLEYGFRGEFFIKGGRNLGFLVRQNHLLVDDTTLRVDVAVTGRRRLCLRFRLTELDITIIVPMWLLCYLIFSLLSVGIKNELLRRWKKVWIMPVSILYSYLMLRRCDVQTLGCRLCNLS